MPFKVVNFGDHFMMNLVASSLSSSLAGDTHLAMFRVSKVEDVKAADTAQETEGGLDTDNEPDNTETN